MTHAGFAEGVTSPTSASMQSGTEQAIELMTGFADRTGLPSERSPRRYLWTDAFAVCNLLGIAQLTGDRAYLDLAQRLVDQVHGILGRYDANDSRRGWISGLDDAEGVLHPTRGGLRIGKPLPERQPGEAFDAELEWERDGQYFHYLTKWMHALDQLSRATRQERFNIWARELAASAHEGFTYRPSPIAPPRLAWKMSVDLTRPLVPSMGQHDALDGFITCAELELTARNYEPSSDGPALSKPLAGFASMMEAADWATGDPLGIGGLLADAARASQLLSHGAIPESLLRRLLGAALESLDYHLPSGELRAPVNHRLAFRELGLAIGLSGVDLIAQTGSHSSEDLQRLQRYTGLGRAIVSFWSDPNHRRTPAWATRRDINEIMLATALVPAGFLVLRGMEGESRA